MRLRTSLLVLGLIVGLAGVAAAAEPASLSLVLQVRSDGSVLMTGKVTDGKRLPVSEATVTFQAKTAFGWLVVGEVTTNRAGEAALILPRVPGSGEISAETEAGAQTLRAATLIERSPASAPRTRPGYDTLRALSPQPGFISPYPTPLEVIFLAIVLGGIWITYGYLVSMLGKIRRAPGESPAHASRWR